MSSPMKRYARNMTAAMAAYVGVLVGTLIGLRALPDDSLLRYVLAPLPVLPAVGLVIAFVRYLRDIDELQRRIQLEALAIAFGASALISFCYGFLENAGLPRLSAIWIGPAMVMLWGLSSGFVSRRFR
ncbi:hypothetical protein [Micromonospora carbonacea]|nr:hypothetical protein [Micromonospora carbonacea]